MKVSRQSAPWPRHDFAVKVAAERKKPLQSGPVKAFDIRKVTGPFVHPSPTIRVPVPYI